MRATRRPDPRGSGPNPTYGLRKTLAGSALAAAAAVAVVLALSVPPTAAVAAGAVVAGAAGVSRTAALGGFAALPRRLVRRVAGGDGASGEVCVPHTGVCVEV